ncbi:MAG: MmgE/PrpD family protein [Halapricum sp.]
MSDSSLATRLARYAHDLTYDDLDETTVDRVKDRLLDSLACAYAAMDEPPVRQTLAVAERKSGETPASIIGGGTSSMDHAALANGVLIRYLDWNDTYLSKEPGHPSDNLGAILAVSDAVDASGRETILATALAYELQCRLCDAASLRTHGFDHVNYGLVSATLAVAKLMDLSVETMTHAVNVAVNAHVALRQARAGELSEWKGMAFGNVDRNAVVAAELAREGINGPAPIFEGEFGFFEQVSGEFDVDIESFGGREGTFKINETYVKFYPVEYHAQAAVNCVFALLEDHDIAVEDIERIENETYEAGVSIIASGDKKWRPTTRETADHSMPYCVARAFLDGEMTLVQFAEEKLTDPAVHDLMDRIEVTENEAFTERYGETFPHRMVVHTDEDTYECEREYPKGHYENPLSDAELEAKFATGAEGRLDEGEQADVLAAIRSLETTDDMSVLFDQLD